MSCFRWEVRRELLARLKLLECAGPQLGRPTVDTLTGSSFQNMKELRFQQDDGVWRFAFAFNPQRAAIVLCGGDKEGTDQASFYKELIAKARGEICSAYCKFQEEPGEQAMKNLASGFGY